MTDKVQMFFQYIFCGQWSFGFIVKNFYQNSSDPVKNLIKGYSFEKSQEEC